MCDCVFTEIMSDTKSETSDERDKNFNSLNMGQNSAAEPRIQQPGEVIAPEVSQSDVTKAAEEVYIHFYALFVLCGNLVKRSAREDLLTHPTKNRMINMAKRWLMKAASSISLNSSSLIIVFLVIYLFYFT